MGILTISDLTTEVVVNKTFVKNVTEGTATDNLDINQHVMVLKSETGNLVSPINIKNLLTNGIGSENLANFLGIGYAKEYVNAGEKVEVDIMIK